MTVTGPEDQERMRALARRQMSTQWRIPRPRGVPALREAVRRALWEPAAVSAFNVVFPRLTGRPLPIAPDLDTWRDTVRQAAMWHVDAYVSVQAAQVAHAAELAPHLELTEKALALDPQAPPASHGFMVYTLPVAWTPTRWSPCPGHRPAATRMSTMVSPSPLGRRPAQRS